MTAPDARRLGIGVSEPSYHDGNISFTDLMRQGSAWISHDPEDASLWDDGRPIALDDRGYPTGLAPDQAARTVLLLSSPVFEPGTYTLTWEGRGALEIEANGARIRVDDRDDRIAENRLEIALGPSDDPAIFLTILETDPAHPLTDIHLFTPGHDETSPLVSETLMADLAPFDTIRFMDWNKTNWGAHGAWEDRAQMDWATWGTFDTLTRFDVGVPYEVMIDLGNALGADIWITVPWQADDAYVRQLAELVDARLAPELTVTIEYGNEAWNGWFPIFAELEAEAAEIREAEGREDVFVPQVYARRAVEVFEIVTDVMAPDRVITTLAGQAGWAAVLDGAMAEVARLGAEGLVDQLAIAPYFPDGEAEDGAIAALVAAAPGGISEAEYAEVFARLDAEIRAMFAGTSEAGRELHANRAVAERHGLPLVAYEAGQHIVSWETPELEGLVSEINARPEMAEIYRTYLDAWHAFAHGGDMALFHLAGTWGPSEAFGLKAFGGQDAADAPKYQAAVAWRQAGATAGADTLSGGPGDDRLQGLAGDDTFLWSGGRDRLEGGPGEDTLALDAARAEVALTAEEAGHTVALADGRATLRDVERIALADGSYLLGDRGPDAEFAYLLYRTALGRTPEEPGFLFWSSRRAEGAERREIAEAFLESPEFAARLGDGSDAALVDLLYDAELARPADPAGRAFWLGALDEGRIDRADLLIAFADAAETRALAEADLAPGLWVAHGV